MASFLDESSHDLCFDREIFFSSDFSVDKFVCEKRKAVGLEQLRQDLRSHLKYLQECLLELINEHYTDFVNLSSNLVGLEKYIGNISQPLTKLKDEVTDVSNLIEAVLRETEEKLDQRQKDRQLRGQILLALEVYRGVHRLPKDNQPWNPDLVERTASQIHSLAVSLERCRGVSLARRAAEAIDEVKARLQAYLEIKFLDALQDHDENQLHHVLQIAVLVDRVHFIEGFYSDRIVKPALEEIVTERVLREVLSDGLFNQVIMFVTTNTAPLTKCSPPEYDFILRAVFPVFVSLAETRIPTLFSLTSATMFHVRYSEARRFLETLENHLPEKSIQQFRDSDAYKTFMSRWSIGVYFQLRYTEIATNFETALLVGNEPFSKKNSMLTVTENLYKQIAYCWSEGVFIEGLKLKFLKLTVQLLARYGTFLEHFARQTHSNEERSAITLFQAASDCQRITVESICECCDAHLLEEEKKLFVECLEHSLVALSERTKELSSTAIDILCQIAQSSIRQITDIPRLYRRTNRDIPNAPSAYVNALFDPVFKCRSSSENWKPDWSITFAQNICDSFLSTTQDVLGSVRKMEDSLRRLKKGKVNETQGISDDDKIRLQIMVDVEHFGELLDELVSVKPASYETLFETARNQMNGSVSGAQ
ncbi:conserved oligomeric Golgi complex subunit 2 [Galendromus occidentalis]|uniref:Conserved oligomeric Golgi complex subunit 2 n=1 Tax=Galendromus occidentalis TaxID=34638 RepID=A0AAJ6QXQ1_9ACAR|nr:conserved oligomeric Golgi complex subunit 2 [Galendromus occidentalis]